MNNNIISLKEWNLKMDDFDRKLITCNCALEARDSTLAIIEEIDKIIEECIYHRTCNYDKITCLEAIYKKDLVRLKQKLTGETQ